MFAHFTSVDIMFELDLFSEKHGDQCISYRSHDTRVGSGGKLISLSKYIRLDSVSFLDIGVEKTA